MTTGSCTELLQALKLSLSLSEVRGEVATALEVVYATIYKDIRVPSPVAMTRHYSLIRQLESERE